MTLPALSIIVMLVVFLGSAVWVGFGLVAVGVIGLEVFKPNMPVATFLAKDIWTSMSSPELIALPLFILMGELLFHTRLSEMLFRGLSPWTTRLPGRLMHVNILGCTLFAAASGSSARPTGSRGGTRRSSSSTGASSRAWARRPTTLE